MSGPTYRNVISGPLQIDQENSAQAFVYTIQASSSEILLAPSDDRKGLLVYNDSIFTMYIKFASGVSKDSFSVKLGPEGTYEMSQNILFAGDIYCVWEEAEGAAQVTQLV